jgi:alpha-ketoglutarate-dependent taurine dioxygenase
VRLCPPVVVFLPAFDQFGHFRLTSPYCVAERQRQFLRGKCCVHDFDSFRAGQRDSGVSETTLEELRTAYPVARHPLVRTHPDTGGEMLYVNPNFGRYIEAAEGVPMEERESEALLQTLYAQSNFPEFQCFFPYRPDSLCFWVRFPGSPPMIFFFLPKL